MGRDKSPCATIHHNYNNSFRLVHPMALFLLKIQLHPSSKAMPQIKVENIMMPISTTPKRSWPLLFLLILIIGLTGCSSDDPTSVGEDPDPQQAADLAKSIQGPAEIGTTMADLDMFLSPLSSLTEDVGIGDDSLLGGGWNDEGVGYDFPDKALITAKAFRGVLLTRDTGIAATSGQESPLKQLSNLGAEIAMDKASGDTIAVVYYDTADSTGLDALIETDEINILRLVSQRTYPGAGLLQIAQRQSEIVLDSNGTLENGDDDSFFSIHHEFTRGNGEQTTGNIASTDGASAMGPGVQVRAYHRVDDPSFHIIQAWNEAELVLDPGEFDIEGDEAFYQLAATVHWRNDAEHTFAIAPVEDEIIEPDTDVLITGSFTASGANTWLETADDTLLARLGDLGDESDDLLFEITRSQVFDALAADGDHARNFVRMTPDEPIAPGEEPCGGTAEQDIHYPANWWLQHLVREVDLNCDGSGTMTVAMEFLDGTSYTRTIVWDGEGAATVTENRADGTVLNGSFNESTGAYSLVTTYPTGHDPVSRDRHGTAVEGSIEAFETVVWLDGHDDQTYFLATDTETQTTITGYRIDGQDREDFSLTSNDDGNTTGSWSRNDGAQGQFEVAMLVGGGYSMTFSASDPSAPGSPSMTGKIDFAPDGSGVGTITFTQFGNSVTYVVNFGPDGTGTLEDASGAVLPL